MSGKLELPVVRGSASVVGMSASISMKGSQCSLFVMLMC